MKTEQERLNDILREVMNYTVEEIVPGKKYRIIKGNSIAIIEWSKNETN